MRLVALGACLLAVIQLASALPHRKPETGLSGRLTSNFYLVGSASRDYNKENKPKEDNDPQDILLESSGESHGRWKRSTVVEFHFVSQPRLPRFTYILQPQRLPDPEPEPEPEPIPEPMVEEKHHVLEEESHNHETEEHEEEHESHLTEEEILEEELARAQEEREAEEGQPRALDEPLSQAVARSDDDQINEREIVEKTKKESRRKTKKSSEKTIISRNRPKMPKRPKKLRQPNVVSPPAIVNRQPPMVAPHRVMHPPPPQVFHDKLGLIHMSLETSPTERLDLVQTGVDRYGGVVWGVSVDDRRGNCLAYVHVGPGIGNLNFQPIRGRGNHVDWVFNARDDFGFPHNIHLKNARGHLELVNGYYRGLPTTGILGYDNRGEILIPIRHRRGHILVEDIVHSDHYIIF